MKLQFLDLDPNERRLYIEQAALRSNVSPVVMEKDFWVCWLLSVLFASDYANSLVFKGGTSLSKVFGVIERFSEDIDLSLSPAFLDLPNAGTSRNQANKWMAKAESACGNAVQNQIQPALETAVSKVLGIIAKPWFDYLIDSATRSPVLLFHYPSSQPSGFEYLARSVKLEFGSLTDQQPTGRHPIKPWVADVLPAAFPDWQCEVVALEIERSFWEKATILHTEYHRPADKPTPDRFSRHYADTASLARHPSTKHAIDQHSLRDRVVAWKSQFFGSAWANYGEAKPGSFRLVPPADRQQALRRDYQAMRQMYLTEPMSFDEVLLTLGQLEDQINQSGEARQPFQKTD
ncbi:MAG: nucleotidyl transferase AbiEii/AbiGii toxin family protein [Planctomycetaceae bacterium]